MTDVLKIALNRRESLKQEMAKLDEFIRMAESLIHGEEQRPGETGNGSHFSEARRTPNAVA